MGSGALVRDFLETGWTAPDLSLGFKRAFVNGRLNLGEVGMASDDEELEEASGDDTARRLIAAAGEVFAQSGFRDASVRAICDAAGANVSAVKYHFGSKGELYQAVWREAASQMLASEPMPQLVDADSPREALVDFMGWFMRLVLTQHAEHPWAGQLLAHETVAPTESALDIFVEHCAGPIRTELRAIVRAIVNRSVSERRLDDLTNGVIALCVNPNHSREILTRLGFPPPDSKRGINHLARTLATFALGGLEGFATRGDD